MLFSQTLCLGLGLCCGGGCGLFSGFRGFLGGGLQRGGQDRVLGERLLHRILDGDPATLGAGNGALDHDQATIAVGLDNLQVLRGHADGAHVTGHLLALEHLARVLTLTGRTMRPVADRDAVRGAQAAEVVALHRAGKTLTDRGAADVDELTFKIMVSGDFLAHVDQVVGVHAELGNLALGFDLGDGEVTAHGLARTLGLGGAGAQLDGGVAMSVSGTLSDDLQLLKLKDGHGDLLAVFHEKTGHADLFGNDSGTEHQSDPLKP